MSPMLAPILPGLPGVTETQVGSFKYRLSYDVLCGSFPLPYCTYTGQGHLRLSTQVLEQQDPSRPGSLAEKQPVPTSQGLDRDLPKLWAKLSPRHAGYQSGKYT